MPRRTFSKEQIHDPVKQIVSILQDTRNNPVIDQLRELLLAGSLDVTGPAKMESLVGKSKVDFANEHAEKSPPKNKKNTQEQNHPRKGRIMKVQPITKQRDINTIKRLLSNSPRNYALFTIGINSALRGSDLARIKVGDIRGLAIGEHFTLREKKTQKLREVTINKPIYEAVNALLAEIPDANDKDYLFPSQKGKGPLTTSYLNQMIKKWCRMVNLKGNFGSHSLRKTWGYHARVTFGMDLASLVDCFGHATQKQTLTYLCIQQDEVRKAFMNEL